MSTFIVEDWMVIRTDKPQDLHYCHRPIPGAADQTPCSGCEKTARQEESE